MKWPWPAQWCNFSSVRIINVIKRVVQHKQHKAFGLRLLKKTVIKAAVSGNEV